MKKFSIFMIFMFIGFLGLFPQSPAECTSSGNNQSYEWISGVGIGSFYNSSGASGYTDFTSLTINLDKGVSTPVSLTPGFSGSSYTEFWAIWIDLNHDGDLTSSEQVFSGSSSSTLTGSLTVPSSAVSGNTRLRVSMQYYSIPTPCGTFQYGEVEDYTVNIAGGVTPPPQPNFIGSPTVISVGGNVQFTDQSYYNPTSWAWSFDGGSPSTSSSQNPVVTYNSAGLYDVTLTVSNAYGSDTITKYGYITVEQGQPVPVADFYGTPTEVELGGSVNFYDQSTNNPTNWSWTFNGGSPSSSSAKNPVVTYNQVGTFSVSLTVSNSSGSNTRTRNGYITVTSIIPPDYCASQGNNNSYEWIAGVQVGSFSNSSGSAGYSDFTSMVATLSPGTSQSVSLTPGFSSSSYTEYWRIWIDFNTNSTFDTNELVFEGVGSSVVSGSISIPSSLSGTTRMRVSMKYSGYPTACGSFTYGEVEDYTVEFSGSVTPIFQDLTVQESYTLIQQNQGNANFVILDVRTSSEFNAERLENSINLDFYSSSFDTDLNQLDKSKAYLVYCNSGNRSAQTLSKMQTMNFMEAYNMLGGITQWKAQGLPTVIFQHISVQEAYTLIQDNSNNSNFVILDVRTASEFASGHIQNAMNLDFYSSSFDSQLNQLDKTKTYLVYCKSGNRSGQTFDKMVSFGFKKLYNMLGGFDAWSAQGYPIVQ